MAQSVSEFFRTYIAHESVHLVPDLDYNPFLNIFIFPLGVTEGFPCT